MSKKVLDYCGKFDLLYAVTPKAIGTEDEMQMRKNVCEILDRVEPVINSIEKPGRAVVYVCPTSELPRTMTHTSFFKQTAALIKHGLVAALVWTLPSKEEYDEFEAHCDLVDDVVVAWYHEAQTRTLDVRFEAPLGRGRLSSLMKPFSISEKDLIEQTPANRWILDRILDDALGKERRTLNNDDLFGTNMKKPMNKFVYKGRPVDDHGRKTKRVMGPDHDSTPAMEYEAFYALAERNDRKAKNKHTGEIFYLLADVVRVGVYYIFPLERRSPDWYETISHDILETKYKEL